MARVKGICYGNDAFLAPYDESNANSFQCTYGSNNAADYVAPLHGAYYQNSVKLWRQDQGFPAPPPPCPEDIGRMHFMGVELIRLYDWDARNSHQLFLDK
jgi:hypothetical protein